MIAHYMTLVIVFAITLNHANRFVRAFGTLLVTIALAFILPRGSADRDMFVAAHQTLGVTVLVLILLRLMWLSRSAPPSLSPDLEP